MLASRPILMTNGRGPARGVLIFADITILTKLKLSNIMNFPISLEFIDNWQKIITFRIQIRLASYIKPVNQAVHYRLRAIDGINQQPIFVVGATMPRTVFDRG